MANPPRRRGRPPLDPTDSTTHLAVRVPSKLFDRVCHAAGRQRLEFAEFVRQTLREKLDEPERK